MSWGEIGSSMYNKALEVQKQFQMNAEKAARESAATQHGSDLAKKQYEEAIHKTTDFYTPSKEAQQAMDQERAARMQQMRQEVGKKMMETAKDFMSSGAQNATSLGSTLSSGAAAASHLGRMGAGGMGAGGFASGGLIAVVGGVVAFCAIVTVFAIALNEVAKNNAKRRAELEAARTRALIELENQIKFKAPQNRVFMPKNL